MKTQLECGVGGSMTAVLGRSVQLHLVRSVRRLSSTVCFGLTLDSAYPSSSAVWDTLR